MPLNWLTSYARAQVIRRGLRSVRPRAGLLPIIYLPGILGVKLFDRQHQAYIWGDYRNILFRDPGHAGFALRPATGADDTHDQILASEPLHYFTIIPGLLDSLVTAEVKHVLEQALGYREGRDLFFLGYDWRHDYRTLARHLEHQIRTIRRDFGPSQQVIVLGQSVANLAVRYLVRHGPDDLRGSIAKWYAFGPTWRGTYNALEMLRSGYYPATRRFHGFSATDAASYPSCYQLLPHDARLLDRNGRSIDEFDLYDIDTWVRYGFGPAQLADSKPLQDRVQQLLRQAQRGRADVEGTHPRDHSVVQTWFVGERNHAVTAAVEHADGALVSESEIRAHVPHLASQTLARGDDHIPLRHMTDNPCGPLVKSYDSIPYGESYVLIGQPKDHRAIINEPANLKALARDIAEITRRV